MADSPAATPRAATQRAPQSPCERGWDDYQEGGEGPGQTGRKPPGHRATTAPTRESSPATIPMPPLNIPLRVVRTPKTRWLRGLRGSGSRWHTPRRRGRPSAATLQKGGTRERLTPEDLANKCSRAVNNPQRPIRAAKPPRQGGRIANTAMARADRPCTWAGKAPG
ncbi:hypothetical protein VTN49DRAFT_6354 [Thermomyces lanuginosus]